MNLTAQLTTLNARLDSVLLQGGWWPFGGWGKSRDIKFRFNAGGEEWMLVSNPGRVRLFRGSTEVQGLGEPGFEVVFEGERFQQTNLDWGRVHSYLKDQGGVFNDEDSRRLQLQMGSEEWLNRNPDSYQQELKNNIKNLMQTPRFRGNVLKVQVISHDTFIHKPLDDDVTGIVYHTYGVYRVSFTGITPGARIDDVEPTAGVFRPVATVPDEKPPVRLIRDSDTTQKKRSSPQPHVVKERNPNYPELIYTWGVKESIYTLVKTWSDDELRYVSDISNYAYTVLENRPTESVPGTNSSVATKLDEIYRDITINHDPGGQSHNPNPAVTCSKYFILWLYSIAMGNSWTHDFNVDWLKKNYNIKYMDIYNIVHEMGVAGVGSRL